MTEPTDEMRAEMVARYGDRGTFVTCEVQGCDTWFFYVKERDYPYRCLDHAETFRRLVGVQ